MAPALTETTTGQSQKFALTMSPPLPGIDKLPLNHTSSTSYFLENEKHSKTKNNNSEIYAAGKQRQRRQVNGRGPPQILACVSRQKQQSAALVSVTRKRPASGSVILKYEVGCKKKEPAVNGKSRNSTIEEVVNVEEKCINSKLQSCTMNGKTVVVDEDKCVNRDLETNKKTMGTLKANSAGHVLNSTTDTNGNKEIDDESLSSVKDDNIITHSGNDIENSYNDQSGSKSVETPVNFKFPTPICNSMSGPGPPSSPEKKVPQQLPPNAVPRNGTSCQRLVIDKTEARLRFQANLERRTDNLLRRIYKLQTNHAAQHVSRQMMDFIGAQRKALLMPPRNDRTSLLRLKLISSTSVPSSSTLVDMKERILQSDDVKNLSTAALVNLVRKLEYSADMVSGTNFPGSPKQLLQEQSPSSSTSNCLRRFGVTKTNSVAPAIITEPVSPVKLDPKVCDDMEWTSGNLLTNLRHLEKAIDSDATASSSGGESCDEMEEIEEKRSKFIPFYKRAAWKWAVDRAGVISRWTWLQAQVSDLEYRIRQTGEIYRQLRVLKDPVLDEKALGNCSSGEESAQVNGFVSGATPQQQIGGECSRTCPLRTIKRKLLRTADLPQISRKAARLCNLQCSCTNFSRICNICCGRVNHTQKLNVDYMDLPERMSYLDPSFHSVLSFKQDIPLANHFEAILSGGDQGRFNGKQRKPRSTSQINDHARKQCRKLKKNATATLTGRFRNKITNKRVAANRRRNAGHSRLRKFNSKDDRQRNASESSGLSSKAGSPVPSPGGIENSSSQASGNSSGWSGDKDMNKKGSMFHELMKRKRGESAFDIDNIVIPYSMAASTRVERLQYKEIITPKWRIAEDEPKDLTVTTIIKEEDEDASDEACIKRHDKCEQHEKKRFMNYKMHPIIGRRSRSVRSDSRADSSGANTPDPLSPHNMVEHHDFPLSTPPSTPAPPQAPSSGEDPHSASRRRTTSLSKRDRMNDDFRVPTPDLFIEPVAPWDTRTFPLSDEIYETMIQESVIHEAPVSEAVENRTEENESYKGDWNMINDSSTVEHSTAIPPEPSDDPDWVPETKTIEGEQHKSSRHSIVLKLAKR